MTDGTRLEMLGADAAACVGDVCEIPGAVEAAADSGEA